MVHSYIRNTKYIPWNRYRKKKNQDKRIKRILKKGERGQQRPALMTVDDIE